MTEAECMAVLGLGESASMEEIKRAYRRMAQRIHPDKRRDDPGARDEFIALSQAYRVLMGVARAAEAGQPVGVCRKCGVLGGVMIGPDGHAYCESCVFEPVGHHLLPWPTLVVVKCVGAAIVLAGAAGLLVAAWSSGQTGYAAGAALLGLLGLGSLAHTCLTVGYCVDPRERSVERRRRDRAGR